MGRPATSFFRALLIGALLPLGALPSNAADNTSWPQRWNEHLHRDVLPFWTAQTIQSESLLLRLRNLDVFAMAITRERDADRRRQLRDQLEQGLAEIRRHFHDPKPGDWRTSATPSENPHESKLTADQIWAALVLADIHLRVGHPEALRLARSTFARIDAQAHDAKHGGWFISYPTDEATRNDHTASRKHAPTQLHVLLALSKLHRADPQDELVRSRLEEIFALMPRFVSPETGHVRWALARDWTPAAFEKPINNQTLYGQNAEAITYLLAASDALGRARRDILPLLENITRALIRDGISPEGAVYYVGEMNGPAFDQRLWWWVQVETAAALWQLHEATGNDLYRDAFNKVSAYTFAHFIPSGDAPRGRWHTLLSADGTPLQPAGANHESQSGYHVARSILAILPPPPAASATPADAP